MMTERVVYPLLLLLSHLLHSLAQARQHVLPPCLFTSLASCHHAMVEGPQVMLPQVHRGQAAAGNRAAATTDADAS